jgi:hypothetical protein
MYYSTHLANHIPAAAAAAAACFSLYVEQSLGQQADQLLQSVRCHKMHCRTALIFCIKTTALQFQMPR